MEPATNNAECTQPLPLFRHEALAAREKLQGDILSIRPFSFWAFLILVGGVIVCGLGFLMFSQYQPRTTVSGSISSVSHDTPAMQKDASSEATFYAPEKLTQNIRPGARLTVHWPLSSNRVSLPGTVVGVGPVETAAPGTGAPDLAVPGPVYKVTVAISLNSLPAGADRVHPGAKLEAEFPLERRPLLRWLIQSSGTVKI